MKIHRAKNPDVFKPLAEGEAFCTGCKQHIDACKCLEIIEVPDANENQST